MNNHSHTPDLSTSVPHTAIVPVLRSHCGTRAIDYRRTSDVRTWAVLHNGIEVLSSTNPLTALNRYKSL